MEDLKEQLRARNKRDQDISRRLNNGHNAIAQVSLICSTARALQSVGGLARPSAPPKRIAPAFEQRRELCRLPEKGEAWYAEHQFLSVDTCMIAGSEGATVGSSFSA